MGLTTFALETKGHCFICLSETQSCGGKLSSFHKIHRHLQLNLRKLVGGMTSLSPASLEALEKSEMMAVLCSDCAKINSDFGSCFDLLEMAQMEVNFCLGLIRDKIRECNDKQRFREKMLESNGVLGSNLQYEIVEKLRNETSHKCSSKLGKAMPRVKLERLATGKEVPNPPQRSGVKQEKSTLKNEVISVKKNGKWHAKCGICNKKLGSRSAVIYHIETVHEKRVWKCIKCQRKFKWRTAFHLHIRNGCSTTTCRLCNQTFLTKAQVLEHERVTNHNDFHPTKRDQVAKTKFECSLCRKSFGSEHAMRYHKEKGVCSKRTRIPQQAFQRIHPLPISQDIPPPSSKLAVNPTHSSLADQVISINLNVKDTLPKNHAYKCNKCHRKFSRKSSHVKHVKNGCSTFKCGVCLNLYSSLTDFLEHQKLENHYGRFKCQFCNRDFCQKHHLDRHMKNRSCRFKDLKPEITGQIDSFAAIAGEVVPQENKFKCNTPFRFKKTMKKLNSRLKCQICNKVMCNRYYLEAHISAVHNGAAYNCNKCHLKFSWETSLKRHLKYDKCEEGFVVECEVCQATFLSIVDLVRHKRGHADSEIRQANVGRGRPSSTLKIIYPCGICPKKFSAMKTVNDHRNQFHTESQVMSYFSMVKAGKTRAEVELDSPHLLETKSHSEMIESIPVIMKEEDIKEECQEIGDWDELPIIIPQVCMEGEMGINEIETEPIRLGVDSSY